ncbi:MULTISPECIES: hypothetical protein [unclassified Streptomyces]|uniref:hypothetical protein n=1 Tax=unclassified Streptomyces TaxID=2593676 RepID=UPI0036FFCADF
MDLVRAGIGVAFVPRAIGERAGLPCVRVRQPEPGRTVVLAGRGPAPRNPAAAALARHLTAAAPATPGGLTAAAPTTPVPLGSAAPAVPGGRLADAAPWPRTAGPSEQGPWSRAAGPGDETPSRDAGPAAAGRPGGRRPPAA